MFSTFQRKMILLQIHFADEKGFVAIKIFARMNRKISSAKLAMWGRKREKKKPVFFSFTVLFFWPTLEVSVHARSIYPYIYPFTLRKKPQFFSNNG